MGDHLLNSCTLDVLVQDRQAGRCLENLLTLVGPIDMGFRIQGLAAHILLAQGLKVVQVNSQGHPDIVAVDNQGTVRFEVEANTLGVGSHQLTPPDLTSLRPLAREDRGYFAVAICRPYPRWLIVNQARVALRDTPAPLPVLQALSEVELSGTWTRLFNRLIVEHCRYLQDYSFDLLAEWARKGQALSI